MGFYINQGLTAYNKASDLIRLYNGTRLTECPKIYEDIPDGKVLVVVVENGIFDAAGVVVDECEFRAFTLPTDRRPKQYVLLDKQHAFELCGYKPNAQAAHTV